MSNIYDHAGSLRRMGNDRELFQEMVELLRSAAQDRGVAIGFQATMNVDLCRDGIGEDAVAILDDRRRGLIAGGLDAEDAHTG